MMKCFVRQNRGKTAWQKFRFSWFYRIFRPVARTNQSCLQAGSRQSKRFANRYCLCSKAGHRPAKVERNSWRILAVNLQQLRSKRFCHLLGLFFMLNTIGIYGNAVLGIVFFQAYATRQAIGWSQKKQDSQNLKCCDDNSFTILSHCCNVMGHLIPQPRICSNNSISRFAIPRLVAILRQPLMAFVAHRRFAHNQTTNNYECKNTIFSLFYDRLINLPILILEHIENHLSDAAIGMFGQIILDGLHGDFGGLLVREAGRSPPRWRAPHQHRRPQHRWIV